MGCVSSKTDINDLHPNIFQVMNVDEVGHVISPGQLELTESELVLYQRGKLPTKWPLRCLRKYGFDSEIFSFECGRRCPTGPGIYAFRCRKAEQLFNMLQQNIQLRNLSDDTNMSGPINTNDFPVPFVSTGVPVQRRLPFQSEGYLNPSPAPVNIRPHPSLSRPGSINSNGPISPPAVSPPPTSGCDVPTEHNNNKRDSLIPEHSYLNTGALVETEIIGSPSYINIANVTSPTTRIITESYVNLPANTCHLYMNVNTNENTRTNTNIASSTVIIKDMPNAVPKVTEMVDNSASQPILDPQEIEDPKHCYANIDSTELESLRPSLATNVELPLYLNTPSVPQTPTALCVTVREVNYAELDLVPSQNDTPPVSQNPDSPNKTSKSYVTIDFKKTNALSQSINPRMEVEEGSRKTRHNSSISDVPTRRSNSLSD